eukprot:NODE_5_length_49639_cov_0.484336.p3 type:complete len:1038 gc:universal NODE_5_length_49639_cov_0.484336:33373-30260(-)
MGDDFKQDTDWHAIVKNSSLHDTINSIINRNVNLMAWVGALLNLLNNRHHVEESANLFDDLLPFISPYALVEFYQDFIVSLLNAEAYPTLARVIHRLPSHLYNEESIKDALLNMDEGSLIIACLPKPPMLQNTKDDPRIEYLKSRKLSLETVVALSSQKCLSNKMSIDLLLPYIRQLQKKHAYSIYQCLRTLNATPAQMNLIISNLPTKPGQSICLAGLLNNISSCRNYSLIVCGLIQGMFEPEKEFLKSILKLILDPIKDINQVDNSIVQVLEFININLSNIKFLFCWDFMVLYLGRLIITWNRTFITTHAQCECTLCLIKRQIRQSLSVLGTLKSSNFPYERELEIALKSFFSILPIEEISCSFELNQMDWPWYYLTKYPIASNFEYVLTNILPMYEYFINYSLEVASVADKKKFEFLSEQVLDVVVQSCTFPSNLHQGYTLLGKQFNVLVNSHPKFISLVLIKIKQSYDKITNNELTPDQALLLAGISDEITKTKLYFSSSMKFVMPTLLNKYLDSVDPSLKTFLKSAIIAIVPTCPQDVLQQICTPAISQIGSFIKSQSSDLMQDDSTTNVDKILDICDILVILAAFSDSSHFYSTAKQLLLMRDPKLQKKGYRLLEPLIPSLGIDTAMNTISQVDHQKCLARKERCRVLEIIVQNIPDDWYVVEPNDEFLKLISEIIYATKENSEKARTSALNAINLMCLGYSKLGKIEDFINVIAAGMVNSKTIFISASILALSRAIYASKSNLDSQYLMNIYDAIRHYYKSNQKAITKSIFIYIKIMLSIVDTADIKAVLRKIGPDFSLMQDRNKIKQLMQRLLKKISRTELLEIMPTEYHKSISNIVKEQRKMERTQTNGDKTVVKFDKEFNDIAFDGNSVFTAKTNKTVFDKVTLNDIDVLDINDIPFEIKDKKDLGTLESMFKQLDGKYVINEDEYKEEVIENNPEDLIKELMTSREMGSRRGTTVTFQNMNKKRKQHDEEFEDDPEVKSKLKKNNSKKRKVKFSDTIGKAYRSKKGKGDVKKSGQLDPYAYIPLGK